MDGVFVAFHNTARTFGFQYIPLEEMDRSLFGNSFMGDQSFLISLKLLNEIFDTATSRFPNKVRDYHMFVYKTFHPNYYSSHTQFHHLISSVFKFAC